MLVIAHGKAASFAWTGHEDIAIPRARIMRRGLRGFNSRLIGTPAFILNAAVTVGSGMDRAGGGHSGSAETALTNETTDVFHLLDVP
ncbi:MAG: hypothetical protein ACYC58_12545 [Pseudomonadaceae bacterium]